MKRIVRSPESGGPAAGTLRCRAAFAARLSSVSKPQSDQVQRIQLRRDEAWEKCGVSIASRLDCFQGESPFCPADLPGRTYQSLGSCRCDFGRLSAHLVQQTKEPTLVFEKTSG